MKFLQKMPLYFFFSMVQKSQNDRKLKSRGPALKKEEIHEILLLSSQKLSKANPGLFHSLAFERFNTLSIFVQGGWYVSKGKRILLKVGGQTGKACFAWANGVEITWLSGIDPAISLRVQHQPLAFASNSFHCATKFLTL